MTAHNNCSAGSAVLREDIAKAIWLAESRRAMGRERTITWYDVAEKDRESYLFLADAVLNVLPDPAQAVQVRNATIEECAKVADVNYGLMYTALRNKEVARAVADQIARGIRNLAADQPPAAPVETGLFNRIATLTIDDQGHRNSELQQVLVAGYVALKWALPLQGAAETIAAIAALVKSASAPCSSQNTAESSPPVMSGDAEADTQCSADMLDALAKTIWLAEFERAFSRAPTDPWENQAESAKASHLNTARKIIEAGFVNAALPQTLGESDRYVHIDNVVYHLDDVEVDAEGKCCWTDVANAQQHIKACRERLPDVPQGVREHLEKLDTVLNGRMKALTGWQLEEMRGHLKVALSLSRPQSK